MLIIKQTYTLMSIINLLCIYESLIFEKYLFCEIYDKWNKLIFVYFF